jgi:xanthine dehydrogenase accessory factor
MVVFLSYLIDKNNPMKVWNFIREELSEKRKVMLVTVVERNGSSPGVVGFKMAVSESGEMSGSIGGGVMEYNMVNLARKELQKSNLKPFIKHQIHQPDAGQDKSGLMCSGEQTHAFLPLDKSDFETINNMVIKLDIGENGLLQLSNKGIVFNDTINTDNGIEYQKKDDENWEYTEQIGLKDTIYIFGAGHVSVPVSQIFRLLDFKVVLLDDRKDLPTFENNMYVHQKKLVDFKNISDIVPEGNRSYAVIMTVGHKSDEIVLKQLVTKNLKYLGMIGSKKKVQNTFESLIKQGIKESELKKVDSPIGLDINSKTTAEIGISIAAKVVQVRNC